MSSDSSKISIWVFGGSDQARVLSFSRRKFAAYTVLFFLAGLSSLWLSYLWGVDSALRVVQEQAQIFAESGAAPESANTVLGQKVKEKELYFSSLSGYLAKKHVRLKHIERELRARVAELETVVNSALNFKEPLLPTTSREKKNSVRQEVKNKEDLGIGGSDKSPHQLKTATLALPMSETEYLALSSSADNGLLGDIDSSVFYLAHLPMGPPVIGRVSSPFGRRRSPFRRRRRMQMHSGLDIAVDRRSQVRATANGLVVEASYKGPYGKMILIQHTNSIQTVYGHLSSISVKKGQRVCRGQRIGLVGSTGRSTGPHVHYEVRIDGEARDPKPFVELPSLLDIEQKKTL